MSAPQSLPGIDIVFDDNMPPGLLAQTRTITVDDVGAAVNAQTGKGVAADAGQVLVTDTRYVLGTL